MRINKRKLFQKICQNQQNYVEILPQNVFITQAYSEPCQTSKIERFAKIVNVFQPLTTFAKRTILDVWQGSEYPSELVYLLWHLFIKLLLPSIFVAFGITKKLQKKGGYVAILSRGTRLIFFKSAPRINRESCVGKLQTFLSF